MSLSRGAAPVSKELPAYGGIGFQVVPAPLRKSWDIEFESRAISLDTPSRAESALPGPPAVGGSKQ